MRIMLKSKIHRATVTGADVNYEGSITLDPILMEAADILSYEQVQVLDITLVPSHTYAIEGSLAPRRFSNVRRSSVTRRHRYRFPH